MLFVWLVIAFVLYAGLCRAQRYKQRDAIATEFHLRRGPLLTGMTLEDAWKIQKWLAEQEFPKTLSTATFFALFKVRCLTGFCSHATLLTPIDIRHSINRSVAYFYGTHDKIFLLFLATYCRYRSTSQQYYHRSTSLEAFY